MGAAASREGRLVDVTEEMVEAFEDAGTLRGYGGQMEDVRAGLAAVLAIVERDYDVRQTVERDYDVRKIVVHLGTRGDWHLHCCGMDIGDMGDCDTLTLDPHGVTCKGPS